MAEMVQAMSVVGTLYSQGKEYDLLQLTPAERFSHPLLLSNATPFYVRGKYGYATHVIVRGDFLVEVLAKPVIKDVFFAIENEQEVPEIISDTVLSES